MFHCHNCFCTSAYRAILPWYQWPLTLLFLRPYRCGHCNTRFWGFTWQRFNGWGTAGKYAEPQWQEDA